MIEKITIKYPDFDDLKDKINEIIDIINAITIDVDGTKCVDGSKAPAESVLTMVDNQVTADLPNIDLGELAFLSKENTELKDEIDRLETELERTRKALDIAVDALKYANKCIKGGCVNWETEIDKALEQITALEQKDVK